MPTHPEQRTIKISDEDWLWCKRYAIENDILHRSAAATIRRAVRHYRKHVEGNQQNEDRTDSRTEAPTRREDDGRTETRVSHQEPYTPTDSKSLRAPSVDELRGRIDRVGRGEAERRDHEGGTQNGDEEGEDETDATSSFFKPEFFY